MSKVAHTVVSGKILPLHQVQQASASLNQYCVVNYTAGVPSAAFSGAQECRLQIRPSDVPNEIRDMTIRFKVANSVASDVQLCPTPYFVDRVELWQNADRMLHRLYADDLYFHLAAFCSNDKARTTRKLLNLQPETWHNTNYLPASATQYYHLPVVSALLEHHNLNLKYIQGDLYVRIFFANGITSSGSNQPTLGQVDLIFNTGILTQDDLKVQQKLHEGVRSHVLLEPVQILDVSKSWTASTKTDLSLKQVRGKVPFVMFALRASQSNTANGYLKNVNVGDNTTVSVATSTGRDILFNGSPMRADYIQSVICASQFRNTDFIADRNVYVLPFCQEVQKSIHGVFNGFRQFVGDETQLSITTAAAGTKCAHTIDLTNAPTSNYFKISWRGAVSDSLAYNTSAANLKVAFDGLTSAQNHPQGPITSSWSQALSAGDPVITLSSDAHPYVNIEEPIQIIWESATGASQSYSTSSITTRAQSGFLAATYQLVCYAYVFKQYNNNKGRLTTEDL